MHKRNLYSPLMVGQRLCATLLLLSLLSCKRDKDPSVVRTWDYVPLKAQYEVPAPAGRNEEGYAILKLLSDNSLEYIFYIGNLSSGDSLTTGHIHYGDAASGGAIIIDLNTSFRSAGGSGTVANLRAGQIDTLLNKPVYINIHSRQLPSGIVRGQLDKRITFATDLSLSGSNEAPPVSTTATGKCILRLTNDKVLYSNITVNDLESGDMLTAAHIHRGAAGMNGQVRVSLANSGTDFGVVKLSAPLHDSVVNMLMNDPMYVNVHSMLRESGLIRGQIR